jgi:hypothetical protein
MLGSQGLFPDRQSALVERLGLRAFLDIVDFFEEAGIGLKSMTEP